MRIALAAAIAAATVAIEMPSASAADLTVKARVHHRHHHYRVRVIARPWCVIENLGAAIWTCAPTHAECHAFEVPGTSLYCVRDPIPGRPYALR